jgi:trimeric autotransporter adhesin
MKMIMKSVYIGFAALVLASFALVPRADAVSPPPDGGYPLGNTAEGTDALFSLTFGVSNTAIGYSTLFNNSSGSYNTANGVGALFHNTTGYYNTANGFDALQLNSTGYYNTAVGSTALQLNSAGGYNTATGAYALQGNAGGSYNTASGYQALYRNTSDRNTATGAFALNQNISGAFNTADGYGALNRNTTGVQNTATGYGALSFNNGNDNSAFGIFALYFNTNGTNNSAFGYGALGFNDAGNGNTAVGTTALLLNTTGSNNIALGNAAGSDLTTGNNNIDIGNFGVSAESNTIRIGTQGTQTATYVAGIFGATVTDGAPVIVDTNGHLGTVVSSARFKDEIKPMDKASAVILALKPVTFRYKTERDPKRIPQFGLVAEDVEKTDPDLVIRDRDGKPYTVRYEAVNAMLLNEFLKEHRTVQQQQKEIDVLKAELKQQRALIQKVSAQVEVSKASPRTVLNDQ